MKRLSANHITALHRLLIDEMGGSHGLRDGGLLESAIHSPFQTFDGEYVYPSIIVMAARLAFSLAKNHAFIDGNKRISVLAMLAFLALNGREMNLADGELIKIGLSLADGSMLHEELAKRLRDHEYSSPHAGIFWVVPVDGDFADFALLTVDTSVAFTSRHGTSHTHKNAWDINDQLFRSHPLYRSLIRGRAYDFYPRGRVELRKKAGEVHAIIWLNPSLNREEILDAIYREFGLSSVRVQVKEDHSKHYRSSFDLGDG